MTEDKWTTIPGFPGYYASQEGQILSKKRKEPIILKPIIAPDGHLYVFLYANGHMSKVWIHRAVLLSFKGNPKPGEEGRHLDGVPGNNHLYNLSWGTKQENADDRKRHGTVPVGEKAGTHKLMQKDVIAIRKEYGEFSLRTLARKYGVSHTCIRRAALGIKWNHVKEGLSEPTN